LEPRNRGTLFNNDATLLSLRLILKLLTEGYVKKTWSTSTVPRKRNVPELLVYTGMLVVIMRLPGADAGS
jgi:hypothetical protein